MPFDGTLTPRQVHLLDKLDEVSEYLASEDMWCKRRLHDPNGQRCLLGALKEAHADWLLYQPVISAAREVTGITDHRIETFNDAARTDFSTVRAVLDRARFGIMAGTTPRGLLHRVAYHSGTWRRSLLQRNWRRVRDLAVAKLLGKIPICHDATLTAPVVALPVPSPDCR
jgi:hypothetical protein